MRKSSKEPLDLEDYEVSLFTLAKQKGVLKTDYESDLDPNFKQIKGSRIVGIHDSKFPGWSEEIHACERVLNERWKIKTRYSSSSFRPEKGQFLFILEPEKFFAAQTIADPDSWQPLCVKIDDEWQLSLNLRADELKTTKTTNEKTDPKAEPIDKLGYSIERLTSFGITPYLSEANVTTEKGEKSFAVICVAERDLGKLYDNVPSIRSKIEAARSGLQNLVSEEHGKNISIKEIKTNLTRKNPPANTFK